ncbi:hypothetical protein NCTGTJJY_CDS0021 [Serratia phage 92A1]|nr:hypothetical protein NCTGTJJY_CDS0021 [Serratia phage 92A1]
MTDKLDEILERRILEAQTQSQFLQRSRHPAVQITPTQDHVTREALERVIDYKKHIADSVYEQALDLGVYGAYGYRMRQYIDLLREIKDYEKQLASFNGPDV